jgi:hypothetical protein
VGFIKEIGERYYVKARQVVFMKKLSGFVNAKPGQ